MELCVAVWSVKGLSQGPPSLRFLAIFSAFLSRLPVASSMINDACCPRTSPLPEPGARLSIVRNCSRKLPALFRSPLLAFAYRRAEKSFPPLAARGPYLFYRS